MDEGSREMRWLVVCPDGRHVTLGRHTDPSASEMAQVEDSLRAAGLVGWLAVMRGRYYGCGQPELLMVRPLAGACDDGWDAAAAAFAALRSSHA